MIRLDRLWKTYEMGGQTLHALRNVELKIEQGEHVAIMGPSGSGKSTLLNILGCLDQPSSGEYFLEGRAVADLDADELASIRSRKIGFVFQAFHLIPRLDALANISIPMLFAGVARNERDERAGRALHAVGLTDWSKHRPAELSGGQKQRIAIARAIVMQPSLLLADEPTGNLDSTSGKQILELLCGLNAQGITLITVTHDPNVARLADRVIVLGDGAILREVEGKSVSSLESLFSGASNAADPMRAEAGP
jgi:putative ABC transport system ATP-binding protein